MSHDALAAALLLRILDYIHIYKFADFILQVAITKNFMFFYKENALLILPPNDCSLLVPFTHTHPPHTNIYPWYTGTCTLDFVFSHMNIHTYTEYSNIAMSEWKQNIFKPCKWLLSNQIICFIYIYMIASAYCLG